MGIVLRMVLYSVWVLLNVLLCWCLSVFFMMSVMFCVSCCLGVSVVVVGSLVENMMKFVESWLILLWVVGCCVDVVR